MRTIIFRGKSTIHKDTWYYGDFTHGYGGCPCIDDSYSGIENSGGIFGVGVHEVAPETVGQFTGYTDKNGKKIFEGDIVKLYKELFKVIFKCGEWRLEIISKRIFMSPYFYSHAEQCEIVGNIHDNCELLEG